ncbi:hypothetical protein ACFL27_00585 [candidate division CSSED10-310 bacterium]|uniref:Uncharacterized protein n=1 Tax=candidate division CSSED10-310 bacterium TaxID=2855610 RepID=A0ABV6YRD2_UNCC1
MKDWVPKPQKNLDITKLEITGEQGFVLSRIDGSTSLQDLRKLTGLSEQRLQQILKQLVSQNALVADSAPGDTGGDKTSGGPASEKEQPSPNLKSARNHVKQKTPQPERKSRTAHDESSNYRHIFETRIHPLQAEQRIEMARSATGSDLSALCFDPDARVILALFENMQVGLPHARLIAAHHRNPVGLEGLSKKSQFLNDEAVQRFLFRNVQTSNLLLQKITRNKQLLALYHLTTSGEVAERAKRFTHQTLRTRFQKASGDECVALILKTEGRCLIMLTGIPLNGKTISLLCSRPYHSSFLIQNLARWPSTPPPLIQHLYKIPLVQRSPHLKTMLLQHPNCPGQLKL